MRRRAVLLLVVESESSECAERVEGGWAQVLDATPASDAASTYAIDDATDGTWREEDTLEDSETDAEGGIRMISYSASSDALESECAEWAVRTPRRVPSLWPWEPGDAWEPWEEDTPGLRAAAESGRELAFAVCLPALTLALAREEPGDALAVPIDMASSASMSENSES